MTAVVAPDAFKLVHPREYLRKFVRQGVRPDGRGLTRIRKTTIVAGSIATAEGSALVRCGSTAVLCGVKTELAEPLVAQPRHGFVVTNIDLSPMCSAKFRPGPPSDLAQAMSQRLQDVVAGPRGGILDLDELCVAEGASVWVLFVDLVCLNYDGSVFDTALAAACAALRNLRLPEATYDPARRQVDVTAERTRALTVAAPPPVATTFALFDGAVLTDPTVDEEDVAETQLTVVCDADERLVSVTQTGTAPVAKSVLDGCIVTALMRAKEVAAQIAAS